MLELICDKLSASIVYEGEKWNNASELKYWLEKESNRIPMNPKIKSFITEVFTEVSENGIEKTITKKNLKKLYQNNIYKE